MLPPVDPVAAGIQRCPFLHRLAATEGDDFARNVAVNPLAPASADRGPALRIPVFEELENFSRTFRLFHGPGGVVPLAKEKIDRVQTGGLGAQVAAAPVSEAKGAGAGGDEKTGRASARLALGIGAPAASMSLSNFGFLSGFGDLFNNNSRKPRKRSEGGSENQHKQHKNNSRQRPSPKARGTGSLRVGATTPGPISSGGQCPMRRIVGPLSALLMKGQCPAPIVKMRAALNRTELVTKLRPQDLPIKVLAIAATSAALNIPFGVLREHCRKFSPEWFLVVHATIPFVAMFRKAVLMPKYAVAFTIAAAISGQMVGARLERKRLKFGKMVQSLKDAPEDAASIQGSGSGDTPSPVFSMACAKETSSVVVKAESIVAGPAAVSV